MLVMALLYILFLSVVIHCYVVQSDYWKIRSELLEAEKNNAVGGDIVLDNDEILANKHLLKLKTEELHKGHLNESEFYPAQHFYKISEEINKVSKVFAVLKIMPKGACLHTHLTASVSQDYVFNLTFEKNLYGCMQFGIYRLHFFEPGTQSNYCNWQLLANLRRNNSSFDEWMKSQLTIRVENYEEIYINAEAVWKKFKKTFNTKRYLLSYRPIFENYVYQSLKEFYEDNITYVEYRGSILPLYELNGTKYSCSKFMEILKNTIQRFKHDNPNFLGVKYIYSYYRDISNDTIINCVDKYIQLKKQYSTLIAGFDLIGYEDKARPLQDFVYQLQKHQKDVRLFLHAGETKWYGSTDTNLIDAVLLNASRIGHGLGLYKHPQVLKLIKQRDIAIEITPISNQVLKYINDFRNHPAVSLIAQGFPLVIGNDDHGVWGVTGVSYDWYMVFMAMSHESAELEFLKKLVLNSIHYSAMNNLEKAAAIELFKNQWQYFIHKLKLID